MISNMVGKDNTFETTTIYLSASGSEGGFYYTDVNGKLAGGNAESNNPKAFEVSVPGFVIKQTSKGNLYISGLDTSKYRCFVAGKGELNTGNFNALGYGFVQK